MTSKYYKPFIFIPQKLLSFIQGILTGAISSILLVATILIGANYHNVANKSDLPNSIEKCEYIFKKL